MKILIRTCLPLALALFTACEGRADDGTLASTNNDDTGWVSLFNGKDLSGFETFLGRHGEDQLNTDKDNIITVHDGMVHIYKDTRAGSKVPFGYFSTKKEYAHYHLRFEYKWGEKRFAPRTEVVRDSGVIYHMVGPHKVWPRGVECQVQEHDTGDIYTVMGAQVVTTVDPAKLNTQPRPVYQFLGNAKGGVLCTRGSEQVARVVKSHEMEREGWNTVEVIVRGASEFVHIVNGEINNWGSDIRQLDESGKNWVPLEKGRILFQVEGAEVFYRNIEIKELPESGSYANR